MVNTRVKDPKLRQINRKIDRQKRAKLRQMEKVLHDPENTVARESEETHKKKINELNLRRRQMKSAT